MGGTEGLLGTSWVPCAWRAGGKGDAGEGEVLEATGLSGSSLKERKLCSCQSPAHFLTSPSSSPWRVCVRRETEGVEIGNNVLPELGKIWRGLPPKPGEMNPVAYKENLQLLRGGSPPRGLTRKSLLQVTWGSCSAHRRRQGPHKGTGSLASFASIWHQ